MKRVKVEHDGEVVTLTLTDDERSISIDLNSHEAEELGEGLFRTGRMVRGGDRSGKP